MAPSVAQMLILGALLYKPSVAATSEFELELVAAVAGSLFAAGFVPLVILALAVSSAKEVVLGSLVAVVPI